MNSQYVLQIQLATYDVQGNRVQSPPNTTYGSATFPYEVGATIPAGGTFTFFDGSRLIPADATTTFALSLSPIDMDPLYRFTWTGGTAPGLCTDRAINLSAQSVTLTLNANQTLTLAAAAASFSSVQLSDELLIPGVSTGDPAGPFSEANVGFWVVLGKNGTSSTLQLARRTTQGFSGQSEVVVVTTALQVQAFAPGPVQVGDSVDVVAGFSPAVLRTYVVTAVSPRWFEVVVSDPLPCLEQGVAGTPPIFYSGAKKLAWLRVDQEASLTVNGGASQRLSPTTPGTVSGQWLTTGPVWSLAVQNRSAQAMQALVVGAS